MTYRNSSVVNRFICSVYAAYGVEKVVTEPRAFAGQICACAYGALERHGDTLKYSNSDEGMGFMKWQVKVKDAVETSSLLSTYVSMDTLQNAPVVNFSQPSTKGMKI